MDSNSIPVLLTLFEARASQLTVIANAITLTGDSIHELAQALVVIGDAYNYESARAELFITLMRLQYEISKQQEGQQQKQGQKGDGQQKQMRKQIKELEIKDKIQQKQMNTRLQQLEERMGELQEQLREVRKLINKDDD